MGCQTTLLDGALGTRLQELGLPEGRSSSLWNMEKPEIVRRVHQSYLDAGSEVILTNTFAAQKEEEFIAAVSCATELSGNYQIAGSLGPLASLENAHRLAPQVEFFVLETYSQLRSALDAFKALETIGKPVVVSFAWLFREEFQLFSGETFHQVIQEIRRWPLHALGANCNLGSKRTVELAGRLLSETEFPLWIKPNAGQPGERESPQIFVSNLSPLLGSVRYMGGCCGAHEGHIAALRNAVDSVAKGTV